MIKWSSSPRNHPLKVDGDAFMSEQPWEFAAPPDLTSVKDKIAAYDEDIWEFYKKLTNPYELIFTTTGKWATPASVCMLHPLSRSYFKMVEILQVAGVFGRFINQNMRTAHVCEGPGGFIQAVYDQADRSRKRVTQTVAMTLKPT